MHQVIVDQTTASDNPHLLHFAEEVQKARDQMVRIYKIRFREDQPSGPSRIFTFITASKQIYLDLGTLSSVGQFKLAKLLQHEFDRNDFSELLLFPKGKMDRNSAILVTMTDGIRPGSLETKFTLTPAH